MTTDARNRSPSHRRAFRALMPDLSQSARSWNKTSCAGTLEEMQLKTPVLLIAQEAIGPRRKCACFDDDHQESMRHWRMMVKLRGF